MFNRKKQWGQEEGSSVPLWIVIVFIIFGVALALGHYLESQVWWAECIKEERAQGYSQERSERRCTLRNYERIQRLFNDD